MKVYEVCIKPTSDFATPLQGDCLFGQICWQIAHDSELTGEISELLSDYVNNPFCIVSDPVMRFEKQDKTVEYVMPKAFCPDSRKKTSDVDTKNENDEYDKHKKSKKASWVVVSKQNRLSGTSVADLADICSIRQRFSLEPDWQPRWDFRQSHNSIDRTTGTTGTSGQFAPFSTGRISYAPELVMSVFIGLRDDVVKSGIETALKRIGLFGYGADASTGKGRFEIVRGMVEFNLADLGDVNGNALYALSAIVPEKDKYPKIYFEPFVRFGRHGDARANSDCPFKQPVLKASAGTVLIRKSADRASEVYAGRGITGLSKFDETVEQGYSLVIPMKVESIS